MALTSTNQPAATQQLTTSRGAALYIGAILGPGLLLLPGLAAAEAGPASILAWLALLGLSGLFAAVFSALGRHIPSAGGVMGYVSAGLGPRAGRATGWMFLAGVVGGAPIVCLIGASYVTDLTGGGQLARAAVAAALLLTVIALAAGGLRASAAAQLVLVTLLTAVVVVAVAGSAAAARAGNWAPFAPHGWLSVGSAAATLMFSFVGWEAVAPLTTRFADPSRQLPRAVAIALAVTTALYLGLAVATISVLGPRAATDVPLAGLLGHAVGPAGPAVAAVAAVVLTIGAVNAYISGAAAMAGQLACATPGSRSSAPMRRLLTAIAAAGLLLITGFGLRIVGAAALVAVPTALFLSVYLGAMAAAARVLRGPVRLAALPGALAVTVMLGFCGWALAIPAAVALAVGWRARADARRRRSRACPDSHSLLYGRNRSEHSRLGAQVVLGGDLKGVKAGPGEPPDERLRVGRVPSRGEQFGQGDRAEPAAGQAVQDRGHRGHGAGMTEMHADDRPLARRAEHVGHDRIRSGIGVVERVNVVGHAGRVAGLAGRPLDQRRRIVRLRGPEPAADRTGQRAQPPGALRDLRVGALGVHGRDVQVVHGVIAQVVAAAQDARRHLRALHEPGADGEHRDLCAPSLGRGE
jgi:amino acid efflux transporter